MEGAEFKVYFYFDSITSVIENRELRRSIEEKDMVLASVTHDLRAPLGSISMTLRQVEEEHAGALSANLQDMIKGSLSGCDLLNFLINDILDAAKLVKTGDLKLNIEMTTIEEIFEEIYRIMESKFSQKGVAFETYISDNVPAHMVTDPRRLQQIILNFITNSSKFTTKGRVVLMARMLKNSDNLLEISVMDTGMGIKEEDQ